LFILNGGGLEETLEETLRNAAPETTFVVAANGLTPRTPQPGEPLHEDETEASAEDEEEPTHAGDPHYWLDPQLVVAYVATIRDAFSAADPAGAAEYEANAAAYVDQLAALDTWIEDEVAAIPAAERLLVMNHVSHGYYADRYGFRIIGAVIPSASTSESPTARHIAALTRTIEREDVRAIFVELGEHQGLAQQIADETGVRVIDDLRDHSLSEPGGEADTYLEMMKYDTRRIVDALRQ
jgi:ABC-type Zn uptake system ZnuABC Zn-binding protein ZnuA